MEGPVVPRTRLHPLTPVLKGGKFLAVWLAAMGFQGLMSAGLIGSLGAFGVILVISGVAAVVSWLVTGFEVADRELRVHEGLIFRRTRVIPLERVQAVDVVRPVFARLAGLSELRLEVVGGKESEGRLAYLAAGEAAHLRERLVGHAAGVVPGVEAADSTHETVAEREIHTVAPRDVVIAQALTPAAMAFPFLAAASLLNWWVTADAWSFATTAGLLTTIIGIVQVPVRRLLDECRFTIAGDQTGVRLRHGLLNTRNQTVPPQRIQALSVVRPLLWRGLGWRRAQIDVAGYGTELNTDTGVLLPVGDETTTRLVTGWALDGALHGTVQPLGSLLDVEALPVTRPPRRARWLAPLARPILGFGVTDRVVVARDGLASRRYVIVPLSRIQSVRVRQGPLQRRLRLATVHVDTAGGLHAVGQHRDVAEAYRLAGELADRSRGARLTPPQRTPV